MADEDELAMIAVLTPSMAEQFSARLADAGVSLELKPADVGRGWEVQIWVPRSQIPQARAVEVAFIRERVPDLPPDFDPHATTTSEDCPACGTPIVEGAAECAGCGLGLPG